MPDARLIMVMGLPGSGKTFFATEFSRQIGAMHFNSDRIRKEETETPGYSREDRSDVYTHMFDRVTDQLIRGETVIVDATFSKASYRTPYFDWVAQNHIPLHVIYLEASEATIAERVGRKRPDSDADFAVYRKIKDEYEPIAREHLILNTDKGTTEAYIASALEYINRYGA
jgi:predicted kinase